MKAAIALILDGAAHAAVRRVTLELHAEGGFGFSGVLLPAHISLKQPFQISNVAQVEAFFDTFASSLSPIDLTLTSLEFWTIDDVIIGYLDVSDDRALRPLHERLNTALEREIGNTDAPFDGASYSISHVCGVPSHKHGERCE